MNRLLAQLMGLIFGGKKTAAAGVSARKQGGVLNSLLGAKSRRGQQKVVAEARKPDAQQDVSQSRSTRKPGDGKPLQMVRVQSSNVHSIGYDESNGTLMVRYLAPVLSKGPGGVKIIGKSNSAGPLYHYFDVPPKLWKSFQTASSKGVWVWDNLRIRGTVAGHKYDYRLVSGTVGSSGFRQTYIPRRATGKGFVSRKRFQAGQELRSNIASRRFSTSRKGKEFNRGR